MKIIRVICENAAHAPLTEGKEYEARPTTIDDHYRITNDAGQVRNYLSLRFRLVAPA